MFVKPLKERPVTLHQGHFKETSTTAEATFLIAGMTIGAGILGVPFAVAQVGLGVGLVMIVVLGFIMLALNLMIGEVAVRTGQPMQLSGLAGKYLGHPAKYLVSFMLMSRSLGAILAYIVGAGIALQAIFAGSAQAWSILFWLTGALFIWAGIHKIKKAEKLLGYTLIVVVVVLSFYIMPEFDVATLLQFNGAHIFLPFGVILFAFSGSPAIAEAHAILTKNEKKFERSLIFGTLIPMAIYVLFTLAVVGTSGGGTTEVATVGLGQKFGILILVLGNAFAVLSMGTSYMGIGVAFKETLMWDYKRTANFSTALTVFLPLLFYFLFSQSFVMILEIVGGVFISFEAAIMIWVYWKARTSGDIKPRWFVLHHAILVALPVFLFFALVTLFSVVNLFIK